MVGWSSISTNDAILISIVNAREMIRDIQWFEVVDMCGHVAESEVTYWQMTVKLGFTLE